MPRERKYPSCLGGVIRTGLVEVAGAQLTIFTTLLTQPSCDDRMLE